MHGEHCTKTSIPSQQPFDLVIYAESILHGPKIYKHIQSIIDLDDLFKFPRISE